MERIPMNQTAMNSPLPELPELLASIRSHADLMKIPESELPRLAEEIRNTLIHSLSLTGGHLGPNLGVVELSIALHRVFETPRDKIIFDVSHQAYVHKMLTGRAPLIHTIRQHEGLSGFAKMSESPHDAYGAGHAGTALSAALGMCAARDLKGEDYHVVAVAGDAAFTCGTTLEALNNISQTTKRYITILNDNEWAIDKNVGALAKYFNSLQTSETFSWLRDKTASFIEKLGGTQARDFAFKLEGTTKNLIFPSLLFNKFGLRYFGPLDGHDIPTLIRTLSYIKDHNEPVILHVVTQKGKGYQPALDNPTKSTAWAPTACGTAKRRQPPPPPSPTSSVPRWWKWRTKTNPSRPSRPPWPAAPSWTCSRKPSPSATLT